MKLRNKKTGEIKDVESLGHEKSLRDKYGPQITLSWNTEYENLGECRTYNSLAELNAEWEDYEEPKEYYYLNEYLELDHEMWTGNDFDKRLKTLGNYFETEEEAKKAVEKLKAWKRLKDKGFKFKYIENNHIEFNSGDIDDADQFINDMGLIFGGEK